MEKSKRCLVLIKEVPEEDNVQIDENNWTIKRGGGVINPYDYVALNLAFELKKEGYKIEVMTMGPYTSKRVLHFCLSLGFERGYIVTDPLFVGSDTLATSIILSNAIKYIGIPDIILTGDHSFDGGTGHVPIQIGEILGINSFSHVVSFNIKDEEKAEIVVDINSKYVFESNFPFILSLLLKEVSLMLPSAKDYFFNYSITEITNREINIDINHIGLKGSPTNVVRIKPYVSNRNKKVEYFTKKEIRNMAEYIKRVVE